MTILVFSYHEILLALSLFCRSGCVDQVTSVQVVRVLVVVCQLALGLGVSVDQVHGQLLVGLVSAVVLVEQI